MKNIVGKLRYRKDIGLTDEVINIKNDMFEINTIQGNQEDNDIVFLKNNDRKMLKKKIRARASSRTPAGLCLLSP